MEKLQPLRQLAVLIPRLERCLLQGRGGEQRDQQLPGAEAPQAARNFHESRSASCNEKVSAMNANTRDSRVRP
jgi:hypothetical protein